MADNTNERILGPVGRHFHSTPDGRTQCDLCPRLCKMKEGQRGFCFVRGVRDGQVVLSTYGRASGFCIDPIEKKPLNHFLPGTSVLSFGTAGCNLGCRFCQNHDISKARSVETLAEEASPQAIAEAARGAGCQSVAFTYNDPVIFAEYAIDTARACHQQDIRTVAVTAGYITEQARAEFFADIDATNIDLKAFTEDFYRKLTYSELEPVKQTLQWLVHHSSTWVEITTLLIPGHNDGPDEIGALTSWIRGALGEEIPLHFSAFHPDYKMMDKPRTPASILMRAREQALAAGLKHVYTGNVQDKASQSTYCAGCDALLIGRQGYRLSDWGLDQLGQCARCHKPLAGCIRSEPGRWGSQRRRLHVRS